MPSSSIIGSLEIPVTPNFVSHLECSMTGEKLPPRVIHNTSPKGYPILVRYDLEGVKQHLSKEKLGRRPYSMWRYRELLPVVHVDNCTSLGEIITPLISLSNTAKVLPGGDYLLKNNNFLLVKDESRLPTASFKARGLAMAVSMAKELNVSRIAMPTNGNAGAALSAYSARAGIESVVFCPEDTPRVNLDEIALLGASLYKVNGLINDCGKLVKDGKEEAGWFDVSTLKEPYRVEGKKTMGFELAEQLNWELPDAIFYPTGGGTGLIGMWKAFEELGQIGFIGPKRPKMVAVQSTGCAPIVRAYEQGERHATLWKNAKTYAAGIRVPIAIGDFLILNAIRESNGFAIAVNDEDIRLALNEVAKNDGVLLCPEGAATYAAYKQSLHDGRIGSSERVVLFNCASGLKYTMPGGGTDLDKDSSIDYRNL